MNRYKVKKPVSLPETDFVISLGPTGIFERSLDEWVVQRQNMLYWFLYDGNIGRSRVKI